MTILTLFYPSNNFSRLAEAGLANIEDGGHLAPSSQFEVELDIIISQQVCIRPLLPSQINGFINGFILNDSFRALFQMFQKN